MPKIKDIAKKKRREKANKKAPEKERDRKRNNIGGGKRVYHIVQY